MDDNVVGMLREKTEELNLDHILKLSMGGYTKKSVQDYFAQQRRQQQNAANSFNRDRQATLEEKDKLQKENESLKNQLLKTETDYKALTERIAAHKVEESDYTVEDVMKLKSNIDVLEKDMDEAVAKIQADAQELEHRQYLLEEKDRQIQKSAQETALYQELLGTAKRESDGLRKVISDQSVNISQIQSEAAFLRKIVSDGNVAELNNRITELMGTVERQQAELQARAQELDELTRRAELLDRQESADRASIEELQTALDRRITENEKMESANARLTERLREQIEQNLSLFCAQSDLRVEKAILLRKLDAGKINAQLKEFVPEAEKEQEKE